VSPRWWPPICSSVIVSTKNLSILMVLAPNPFIWDRPLCPTPTSSIATLKPNSRSCFTAAAALPRSGQFIALGNFKHNLTRRNFAGNDDATEVYRRSRR